MEKKANIIYYTCNTHKTTIEEACREQLLKSNVPILSVSLNQDIPFGDVRIVLTGERGPLMMHKQILAGLRASDADYVFLCESDVLYHPSHFDFIPPSPDTIYFNTNVWKLKYGTDLAVWTDDLKQVSGICAYRKILLDFYEKRVQEIEKDGFNRRYEPRSSTQIYQSEFPNVCIRHDDNLTLSKWSPDEFRNSRYATGWKEGTIPEWAKDIII